MAGPSNAELQNRLSRVAKQAADERDLRLAASAQNALGELVSRAADELGEGAEEPAIRQAEMSFARLAAALADDQAATLEHSARRRGGPVVDDRQFLSVLDRLCPGFWPFC